MIGKSNWRGHDIERRGDEWVFSATGLPTKGDPFCPCGHCGKEPTAEDHDGCLGKLPCVVNACCGHGVTDEAYVQYKDRHLRGHGAVAEIRRLKLVRYITERGLISVRKMAKIMDCDIDDITDGM